MVPLRKRCQREKRAEFEAGSDLFFEIWLALGRVRSGRLDATHPIEGEHWDNNSPRNG
jgi:hypothetical protein